MIVPRLETQGVSPRVIKRLSLVGGGMVLANSWPRPAFPSRAFPISGQNHQSGEINGSWRRVQDNQGKRGQIRRPSLYRYQGQGTARHGSRESVRRGQVQGRTLLRRIVDR